MAKAIVMRSPGGSEVLQLEQVSIGEPGPGEVQLRQTAVGVNFHDVYVRSGLYRTLPLPGVPGIEAVGVVKAIGPGVTHVKVGERVGYVTSAYGAYADERLIAADLLIKLPDSVDDRTAASMLVRGLTAELLLYQVHKLQPGDVVLVHAAAGGVGRLLCQWAHHLGATVIGTVGSDEKARIARDSGCDHVILYRSENFVDRVRTITNGRGVDVAYDSVGKDTFLGSLDALARLGHLVNFGQASGPVEPISMSQLAQKSNTVTRPIMFHYIAERSRRDAMAASLFKALADGVITAGAYHEYRIEDVGRAHEDMEARKTAGAVVLDTRA
ncbi:MAG TPA: quinone oxidoreductase [Burkholderiales bacterium]|nr:quinone oxidoreductase [Burkholderiales bacterium]